MTSEVPEEVKKNIRAVLLSKIGGVQEKKFMSDYVGLINTPLNFRLYGYPTMINMLKDLPDVARLDYCQEQGGHVIYGVGKPDTFMTKQQVKAQGLHKVEQRALRTDEMLQPNHNGWYSLCFPRVQLKFQSGKSDTDVDHHVRELFSVYGDVKEVSFCGKFYFVRYAKKQEAKDAFDSLKDVMDIRIPRDRFVKQDQFNQDKQGRPLKPHSQSGFYNGAANKSSDEGSRGVPPRNSDRSGPSSRFNDRRGPPSRFNDRNGATNGRPNARAGHMSDNGEGNSISRAGPSGDSGAVSWKPKLPAAESFGGGGDSGWRPKPGFGQERNEDRPRFREEGNGEKPRFTQEGNGERRGQGFRQENGGERPGPRFGQEDNQDRSRPGFREEGKEDRPRPRFGQDNGGERRGRNGRFSDREVEAYHPADNEDLRNGESLVNMGQQVQRKMDKDLKRKQELINRFNNIGSAKGEGKKPAPSLNPLLEAMDNKTDAPVKLFLGNLAPDMTQERLTHELGDIQFESLDIVNRPKNSHAFIVVTGQETAKVTRTMHLRVIDGYTMIVDIASSKGGGGGGAAGRPAPQRTVEQDRQGLGEDSYPHEDAEDDWDFDEVTKELEEHGSDPPSFGDTAPMSSRMAFSSESEQHPAFSSGSERHPAFSSENVQRPPSEASSSHSAETHDLYISNFNYGTSEENLMHMFKDFNPLSALIVVNQPTQHMKTGSHRVNSMLPDARYLRTYGFVKFADVNSVVQAIIEFNGRIVYGRVLQLNHARPQDTREIGGGRDVLNLSVTSNSGTRRVEEVTSPSGPGDIRPPSPVRPPSPAGHASARAPRTLTAPGTMEQLRLLQVYAGAQSGWRLPVWLPGNKVAVMHVEPGATRFFWGRTTDEEEAEGMHKLWVRLNEEQEPDRARPAGDKRCAAFYQGEWARGLVEREHRDGLRDVFFPDFGNTERLHEDSLCALTDWNCWKAPPSSRPCCVPEGLRVDLQAYVGAVIPVVSHTPLPPPEAHITYLEIDLANAK